MATCSSRSSSRENVLLLPFMAQGHLLPFMALPRLLEQKTTHIITIVNTPLNIQHLRSSLPTDTSIRLAELPFNCSDHGLPPNSENTNSLPPHLAFHLQQTTQALQPAFDRLVSAICNTGRLPLCIISDVFMSWSVETAKKFVIFHSIFNTFDAYGTPIFISLWTHLPHKMNDADEFYLSDFPHVKIHRSQVAEEFRDADGTDRWSVLYQKINFFSGQSDCILVNNVEELETEALQQLRKNVFRRVWAVGPLFPPPITTTSSSTGTLSPLCCTEWLNRHIQDSVLYILFGSQNFLNLSQMMERGKGFEACGKSFIWVIRPPIGFDVNDDFRAEWLPEGFEDRVTERKQGILAKKWAPQKEILSHPSTGAFLSYCGWNSVLESLSCGVPIIGWPMGAEQLFNSKLLEEELGLSVELARGRKAEVRGIDVVTVVGWVMDGESEICVEIRRKAKRMEELIKAAMAKEESFCGSSISGMEDFIQIALASREMI